MNANEFLTWGIWLRHIEPNLATEKKDLDGTRWGRAGRNTAIHELSFGSWGTHPAPAQGLVQTLNYKTLGAKEFIYFLTKAKANICPRVCFRG